MAWNKPINALEILKTESLTNDEAMISCQNEENSHYLIVL